MNTLLKTLFAVEFALILLVIILSSIGKQETITAYVVKENINENKTFKLFTKAVCEESGEHLVCRDQLFIKCNGNEYMIKDNSSVECDGVRLNLSDVKVDGYGVFKKIVDDKG